MVRNSKEARKELYEYSERKALEVVHSQFTAASYRACEQRYTSMRSEEKGRNIARGMDKKSTSHEVKNCFATTSFDAEARWWGIFELREIEKLDLWRSRTCGGAWLEPEIAYSLRQKPRGSRAFRACDSLIPYPNTSQLLSYSTSGQTSKNRRS